VPTVPQTSVIFFALLIGFIVFITLRGELAGYLYVVGLGSKGAIPVDPNVANQIIDLLNPVPGAPKF
jgi:hypothetical protein